MLRLGQEDVVDKPPPLASRQAAFKSGATSEGQSKPYCSQTSRSQTPEVTEDATAESWGAKSDKAPKMALDHELPVMRKPRAKRASAEDKPKERSFTSQLQLPSSPRVEDDWVAGPSETSPISKISSDCFPQSKGLSVAQKHPLVATPSSQEPPRKVLRCASKPSQSSETAAFWDEPSIQASPKPKQLAFGAAKSQGPSRLSAEAPASEGGDLIAELISGLSTAPLSPAIPAQQSSVSGENSKCIGVPESSPLGNSSASVVGSSITLGRTSALKLESPQQADSQDPSKKAQHRSWYPRQQGQRIAERSFRSK